MNFKKYWNSSINVLVAAILGISWGLLFPHYTEGLKTIGDIFIKLIRMLVIPIVFFSILNSTMKLKHTGESGNSAFRALYYFLILMTGGAILGIIIVNLIPIHIQPSNIPQSFMNGVDLYQSKVPVSHGVGEYILNLIPNNILAAFSGDNILQVVLFSIFLGVGIAYYPGESKKGLESAIYILSEVLGWMMQIIMYIVPVAVFSLIAYTVAAAGLDILYQIGIYFITYTTLILFWIYVVLGLLVKLKGNVSYISWIKKIFPLQIFALSTSASLVCLPMNIKTSQDLGANKKDSNIIISIGTTVNLQATAMYYIMSSIFFGKIFGVHFALSQYIAMIVTAVLGAAAAAGVPGTSLLIAAVFVSGGVPLSALPLLFACDRFFDMVVTMGNVIGNTAVPLIVKQKVKN